MSDAMAALFLVRISGRGRVRRTDVEPSQNRKMRSHLFCSLQAAQMLSTLVIIIAIAWVAGPLLGDAILEFGSWRGIFWLMALASTVVFAMIFSLPETLQPQKRSTKPIISPFRNYLRLSQDAKFMRYTLSVTSFAFAAYAFIAGFVHIDYFGIPSKYYGFLFGINIVGVGAKLRKQKAGKALCAKPPALSFHPRCRACGQRAVCVCVFQNRRRSWRDNPDVFCF